MFNLARYSTLSNVVRNFANTKKLFASTSVLAEKNDPADAEKSQEPKKSLKKNHTVAAVFASLNDASSDGPQITTQLSDKKQNLDDIILNAKTVNGLLSIAESNNDISRKHALKIVSILAEWSSISKIKLNEFENDSRFTKLCRVLGRTISFKNANGNGANKNPAKKIAGFRTDDLNTVLGVTGDDEAAKLVASITLPQMVKVMTNLSIKKRRSTPLLRSLAYNISCREQKLDLKQSADILYAMASLNFPDPVLTSKICEDVQISMKNKLEKSSVVGSIVTSLALLKYREPLVLDIMAEWIVKNQDLCRIQDVSSLFMSLATLNYIPTELEEPLRTKLAPSLTSLDFKRSFDYLNFVWSLMVLNYPLDQFFDSVLQQEFIAKLERINGDMPAIAKMKLLNINAGVKLFLPTYNGTMLMRDTNSEIYDVPLIHTREKQVIVNGLVDALKSLVPESCLTLNRNTHMGFVIDAEFEIDDKGNPIQKGSNGTKIAMMVHDYRDMCQGPHQHLNGITALNLRLLEKAGYHILSVPYNEFSISDKLLKRVQYLEKIIKAVNKH